MNNTGSRDFVRAVIASAMTCGQDEDEGAAARYAAHRWGEKAVSVEILRRGFAEVTKVATPVPAGMNETGNWAEDLASPYGAAAAFFAAVRERSLVGRIPGLRQVPIDVRTLSAVDGFEAAWIGEGKPVPVGSASYTDGSLPPRKVAALTVVSRELMLSADPAAEAAIEADLLAALATAIDATFIDPTNAGTAGVKPASVTYGAASEAGTGDGAADLRNLIAGFTGDLERAVLVAHPQTFAVLSDPFLFPLLGVRGGSALGVPAYPSKAAGSSLVLIDPDGIAVGQAAAEIKTTRQGTLQMVDQPTVDSVTPTPTNLVSVWQTNAVAVMAIQSINWAVARSGAVKVLTGLAAS